MGRRKQEETSLEGNSKKAALSHFFAFAAPHLLLKPLEPGKKKRKGGRQERGHREEFIFYFGISPANDSWEASLFLFSHEGLVQLKRGIGRRPPLSFKAELLCRAGGEGQEKEPKPQQKHLLCLFSPPPRGF